MSTGDSATPESGQYPPPGHQYPPPGQQQGAPGPRNPPPGQPQYSAPGAQSGAGQPYPGQSWGQPQGPGPGEAPLTPDEERTWAMVAHLSSIAAAWVLFLGFVGPLVVLLTYGKRSAFVRAQAIEAVNFNISILIYSIVAWILVFVLVGFLILPALFILQVVFTVIAAVKVNSGEPYRYPLTIRLVH